MRKAFTLAEVLVGLTIIGLLAALLYPVASRAMDAGKRANCGSNLRQIHAAITLYRSNNDGDGKYGHWYEMGLPWSTRLLIDEGLMPKSIMVCRGAKYDWKAREPYYVPAGWTYTEAGSPGPWKPYVQKWREQSILMMDMNHQNPGSSVYSELATHRGIGVYLGGHLRTILKKGRPLIRREWWND